MQTRVLNGRYELLTPLGTGGMATVYRGRDLRLGRPVAIKLLHSHYASDDDFLARFQHEAMSAANLSSHPNIVDVYDVGTEGDVNYIVMELVEGTDLKAVIVNEAPLAPPRAINIAIQVAEGLDYAHRRGMIHRDVKPQNVLISPDGEVRIADFGIAKSHLSTAVTQTGITFGTADYISPEQAQGFRATPQSDVYSLAVVLYEMLSGRLPFAGETPMAVAIQHIQKPPPPLRQINPSVPPALEAVVMRSLAKDPQQRPASAKAFAQELRDVLAGRAQPTVINPQPQYQPPPQYQPQPQNRQARPPTTQADAPTVAYQPQPRRAIQPRQQYAPPPPLAAPQRNRGGFGFGTLLLGLMLLGGLIALAYLLFTTDLSDFWSGGATPSPSAAPAPSATAQASATGVPQVTLPNLVGLTEAEAVAQLEQLGLRRYNNPDDPRQQPRNDPAPATTVIEQDPPANSPVPAGSEVLIVISLGPAQAEVPNVANQPFDQARAAIEQAGFVVERREQPSQSVAAGTVISQEPAGNTQADTGATVVLNVSLGDVVAFPDVVANGTLREAAIQQIEAAGFRVAAIDEQSRERLPNFDSFQPNEVVSATAAGVPIDQRGKLVPRGADVVLGVRAP